MTDEIQTGLEAIADVVLTSDVKYRQALRQLIDWQRDREGHQISLQANMGTSASYLLSVSLNWIDANVTYARHLPIFKEHRRGDSDTISINATTLHLLQQREPDFRRQLPMALYLATRQHHKFPPILLVAYQNWVYDKTSDKWGPDGRALEPSLKVTALDSKSCLVDLDVTNTQYFALDGQHRLMAIKGLKDLLEGRLEAKGRDGTSIPRKSMTRDQVEQYYEDFQLDPSQLQSAMDETMGLEVIPAVQIGETIEEAVSRLRNVFVDVNENAKKLEKGELILLDDNDGYRRVARTIMTAHRLFWNGQELRVDTKANQLSDTSNNYTTLSTIKSIVEGYLGQKPEFHEWEDPILGLKELGTLPPREEEIQAGLDQLNAYFNALQRLPSHTELVQGADVSALRKYSDGDGNILFRPIAQVALARAIGTLQKEKGADLKDLFDVIARHEKQGALRLTNKKSPWFGVLCDPIDGKIRRHKRFGDLCEQLFCYLLGGGEPDHETREELRKGFFDARRGSIETDAMAYDMSGSLVTLKEFGLPNPWQ